MKRLHIILIMAENSTVDKTLFAEGKIGAELNKYLPRPKTRLYRLENIESCWEFLHDHSIQTFVKTFCNETLSKVYRLMLFSSEIEVEHLFLYELKRAIEEESLKRKFDCFKLVKQDKYHVQDVIYVNNQIVFYSD